MAATTTQPYLFSVAVIPTDDGHTAFTIRQVWRGNLLATGELVELTTDSLYSSTDVLAQSDWDTIYDDMYEAWSTTTSDDTHSANTIDVT